MRNSNLMHPQSSVSLVSITRTSVILTRKILAGEEGHLILRPRHARGAPRRLTVALIDQQLNCFSWQRDSKYERSQRKNQVNVLQ